MYVAAAKKKENFSIYSLIKRKIPSISLHFLYAFHFFFISTFQHDVLPRKHVIARKCTMFNLFYAFENCLFYLYAFIIIYLCHFHCTVWDKSYLSLHDVWPWEILRFGLLDLLSIELTCVCVSPRLAASSALSGSARYCVLWNRLLSCCNCRLL